MNFDASSLRRSADSPDFPYRERATTFLLVSAGGKVTSDHTLGGKAKILHAHQPGDLLVAAWTGQYRSDMFTVDLTAARRALGVSAVRGEPGRAPRGEKVTQVLKKAGFDIWSTRGKGTGSRAVNGIGIVTVTYYTSGGYEVGRFNAKRARMLAQYRRALQAAGYTAELQDDAVVVTAAPEKR